MESINKTYLITFQSDTSGGLITITQHGQGFFEACRTAMDRMIRMGNGGGWEIVEVHKKED